MSGIEPPLLTEFAGKIAPLVELLIAHLLSISYGRHISGHVLVKPCTHFLGKFKLLTCEFHRKIHLYTSSILITVGALLITVGALLITVGALLITVGATLITVGALLITVGATLITDGALLITVGALRVRLFPE
jgi:integrin beta 3